jgi:hypothetical protein
MVTGALVTPPDEAVTEVEPSATAVTSPCPSTLATDGFEDVQETDTPLIVEPF